MPAELTYTDGTADFFEVGSRRSAWHREGHLIPPDREMKVPDALELIHGDYEVVRRPAFYAVDAAGAELRESKHAYVTVRTDTGHELGSVGRGYTVLQNEDAFRALEPLLDQGVVRLETGGVLRSGADIWMLGRFDVERFGPVVREVFADEVVPYCLFSNNHSGRRTACVALTPIRVVCANTLGYAERRGDKGKDRMIKVSHSGDAASKMVEAARTLLAGLIERFEAVATQYRRLQLMRLSEPAFARLVLDEVAPDPRDSPTFNPEARTAELVVGRAERKRKEIRVCGRRAWGTSATEVPGKPITPWQKPLTTTTSCGRFVAAHTGRQVCSTGTSSRSSRTCSRTCRVTRSVSRRESVEACRADPALCPYLKSTSIGAVAE